MAIGHISVRSHSRRAGHTAAAALAYRAGAKLTDRDGCVHDYRNRARAQELVADGVTAPERWPHGADLQVLSDAIEVAEKRRDARLCRDVQVACPHELTEERQIELVERFAMNLRERYDTPVAWAVHRPGKDDQDADPRNVHAHIILPTRSLNEAGDGFGCKLRVLDAAATGPNEVSAMRNTWADFANDALSNAGIAPSVNVGRKLSTGGHARYSRTASPMTRRLPPRVRSLVHDVRRMLTGPRNGDSTLLDSNIFLTIRQYFALAYARAPVLRWAQPSFQAPLQVGDAISDLIAVWRGPKPPAGSPRAILARPRKVKNADGKTVWGAAIENPPGTLAPGDRIEIETRRGRLRSAEVDAIQSGTRNLALVTTGPQAEILLRAARSSGEVVEVRREADRSITFTDHGEFGRVRGDKVTLSASTIGNSLADEIGARTLQLDAVLQRMAEALQNDRAQILFSTSPSVNAPATAAVESRPQGKGNGERRGRRRRRRRRPEKAPA